MPYNDISVWLWFIVLFNGNGKLKKRIRAGGNYNKKQINHDAFDIPNAYNNASKDRVNQSAIKS